MNTLLIFFALPVATIIISIALQKILRCPWLVAAIIFAIFLIVTFVIDTLTFLVATIAYTIISFITALIVCFICRFLNPNRRNNDCDRRCNCDFCSNYQNNGNGELLTISSNGCNGTSNDLLTISTNNFNGNNNCGCNRCNNNGNNSDNNGVVARINVIPNENTNGRCGCVCGSYRRR